MRVYNNNNIIITIGPTIYTNKHRTAVTIHAYIMRTAAATAVLSRLILLSYNILYYYLFETTAVSGDARVAEVRLEKVSSNEWV